MQGSVQRIELTRPVVEPTVRGAVALADAYWDEIRRLTAGLVRSRRTAGALELQLAGVLALFRFGAPRTTADPRKIESVYPIVGGLLAKQEGGRLAFIQRAAPTPELVVSVEGYVPLLSSGRRRSLRRFVYRQVQERAHAAIGRRYLERMASGRR